MVCESGLNTETLGLLGVGAAVVALTLTRSQVTKLIRHALLGKPLMIGELANCPYCMCHWTGFAFAFFSQPNSFIWYVINGCIITGLAVIMAGVMIRFWPLNELELEEMRQLLNEAQVAISNLRLEKWRHENGKSG